MPGLMEADDDGLYVVKLRGAGQGLPVLVTEVVVGELARGLGLPVPDLVRVEVPAGLAPAEPDSEIQHLLAVSAGENLGVDFLPGALPFTPAALRSIAADLAAAVVWLDALTMNVDRTPRNPNLLLWHRQVFLIDHGAALYRQHGPRPLPETARDAFPMIRDHVLLEVAGPLAAADERLAPAARSAGERAVALVPDAWLGDDPDASRREFLEYFDARLRSPRGFVQEAENARPA